MHAIAAGHEETAKALLERARSVGVAHRLAEAAEAISASDREKRMGRSPLHLSCDKGLTGVVIALLAVAARVDVRDARGATALLYASRQVGRAGGLACVKLFKYGSNCFRPLAYGLCP